MSRFHLLLPTCLMALLLGAMSGCYNTDSLVDEVRNQAIRTRLEEFDLGYYRTTLPRYAVDGTPMEVEVEMFGTAARYKVPEVQEQITKEEYRLRQAVVVAIRQTNANEIADPDLITFRERLMTVVKQALPDAPIESLGFRTVRFIPL